MTRNLFCEGEEKKMPHVDTGEYTRDGISVWQCVYCGMKRPEPKPFPQNPKKSGERTDWRHSRNFMACFFALVSGRAVNRPELPQVLVNFGTMFTCQLVSGWTLQHCFDVCEERVRYMRSKGIPHDAFCLSEIHGSGDSHTFQNSTIFTRIQPSKSADQPTREAITALANAGLVVYTSDVWEASGTDR